MPSTERLLIVIPCYNEAENIGPLLTELARELPTASVVVVDDRSDDETSAIAQRHVPVLELPANLGIGGAVQTGILYAARHDFDRCVQVDGDGQHPPSEVRRLVGYAMSSPANVVIGSRFLEGAGYRSSAMRRIGITCVRWALAALFGIRVSDPTSGMRVLDRAALALFSRRYPHDYPEPISLAMAVRSGLVLAEAPVRMRERSGGVSSIRGFRTLGYMIRVFGALLFLKLQRR